MGVGQKHLCLFNKIRSNVCVMRGDGEIKTV